MELRCALLWRCNILRLYLLVSGILDRSVVQAQSITSLSICAYDVVSYCGDATSCVSTAGTVAEPA